MSSRNSNIGFIGDFGTVQIGANEHFSETDLIFDPAYADFGVGDALSFIQWVRLDSTSHDVTVSQSGGPVTT